MKKGILFIITLASIVYTSSAQKSNVPGSFAMDVGFNMLNGAPDDMKTSTFKSRFFNFYYSYDIEMTKNLLFSIGAGLGTEGYIFSNNTTLIKGTNAQNQKEILLTDATKIYKSVSKSKLALTYLDIPIEIRFRAEEDDDKGLKFTLGGKVGLLIDSHTKINYNDGGSKQIKFKDDFGLSRFRYGVQGRLGYGNFSLFAYYGLSELFQNDTYLSPKESKITPLLIGISITAF